MIKNTFFGLVCMAAFQFGCTQGNKDTAQQLSEVDSVISTRCFVAADGKDTADLKVDSLASGKIKGFLTINYFEKDKNEGEIDGTFKGDTLFVDYTFKIGTKNKAVYKNPLALLRKDGKMVLGVGQIETSLGRSYFVKGKPINFERGRFVFDPVACKD